LGQLVVHVMALGVEPITGKPYKPTTQGKNERFHQTLFRYLDKQPLADTLAEPQAQVDAFDCSTTPNVPTKDSPAGSRPAQRGTPLKWPRHLVPLVSCSCAALSNVLEPCRYRHRQTFPTTPGSKR
jgi:transposase InsO family protein